jgi:putative transposase
MPPPALMFRHLAVIHCTTTIVRFVKSPSPVRSSPTSYPLAWLRPIPKRNRKIQRHYDIDLYKERNLIERLFNKLKQFRRVATRYDKLLANFIGFVKLAAIAIWLR